MARSRETKIELTAYDDLFQTDESREEAKLSKIRDIPISEIDEFPDHISQLGRAYCFLPLQVWQTTAKQENVKRTVGSRIAS